MALHANPNPNPNPKPIYSMQCHGRIWLMPRINVGSTNMQPGPVSINYLDTTGVDRCL